MTGETSTTEGTGKSRARRMEPAARREQIIAAAIRVFAQRGIGTSSHAQVAAEAGVATATVFLYLPNRQTLIDTVLDTVDDYLVRMVDRAAASQTSAGDRLTAIVQSFAHTIDSDSDYVRVFLNWGAAVTEETWPRYIAFQDRILSRLEQVVLDGISSGEVDPGVNAAWAAHFIMGSGNMIAQMKFRDRSNTEVEEFLNALVRAALMHD